jgi:hypothetical protein
LIAAAAAAGQDRIDDIADADDDERVRALVADREIVKCCGFGNEE